VARSRSISRTGGLEAGAPGDGSWVKGGVSWEGQVRPGDSGRFGAIGDAAMPESAAEIHGVAGSR